MQESESGNIAFVAHQVGGASRAVRGWFFSSLLLVTATSVALCVITYIKQAAIEDARIYEHNLQSEVALLNQLRAQKQTLDQSCNDLNKRVHKVQRCTNQNYNSPYLFLKEIANLTTPGITLQSFVCMHKLIQLTGQTQTMRQLTKFMHALEQSKIFVDPKLVNVRSEKNMSGTKILFELRLLKGAQ